MKKQSNFFIISLLLVISRIYDVLTTYLYIPDLKGETNILVKWFGAGWLSVIVIQTLITGIIIYSLHYYIFKFKCNQPTETKLNLKQYISFLHFNNTTSFNKILTHIPKNKNILLASLGYIAPCTLIVAGFVVGTSTTALILSDRYKEIYRNGIPLLLYLFIVISAGYFTIQFYRKAYQVYKGRN